MTIAGKTHRMKHIFSRSGGKSRIGTKIVSLFPKDYVDYTYCEPLLGAGFVWLIKEISKYSLLNDIDSILYNAWLCVKEHPKEMMNMLRSEIKHAQIGFRYLEQLSEPFEIPDVRKAIQFIVASKLFRASIYDPKRAYPRFAIMHMSLHSLIEQIEYLSKRLERAWIYCMDAEDFISKVLSLKETRGTKILFYLDIPYHKTANNYINLQTGDFYEFSLESTIRVCERIDQQSHLFFLSVNSTKETEELATQYVRHHLRRSKIGDELIITNFKKE